VSVEPSGAHGWWRARLFGARIEDRDTRVLAVTQFIAGFSFNFIYVMLPFYIQRISPYDPATTLLWTGLIMGSTGVTSTIFAPVWGTMASRIGPRFLYQLGLGIECVMIAGIALTTSLPVIFLCRLGVGLTGGISTIGLIIVTATSAPARRTANVGVLQSAQTMGQITGPLGAALLGELLGIRGAIFLAVGLLGCSMLLANRMLSRVRRFTPPTAGDRPAVRHIAAAWAICFAASLQIIFLPSILPRLLDDFGVPPAGAVRLAGVIVFSYGLSATAGSLLISRYAGRVGRRRIVALAGFGSAALQALLGLAWSVPSFAVLRVLQTGLVAGILPVVFAEVAESGRGHLIGLINTSRFASSAAGPFLATFLLAHGGPWAIFLLFGGFAAAATTAFLRVPQAALSARAI
jgi:MFS family permease